MMESEDQKMSTAMMSEQRVDPLNAGKGNGEAAGNDGGGGKRIAEHVDEGAADVASRLTRDSIQARMPFMMTPTAAVAIMSRGSTICGCMKRSTAATASQTAMPIRASALTKAASTPARR